MTSSRSARERAFHDQRFEADDPRRRLSFAYQGGFPAMDEYTRRVEHSMGESSSSLEVGCGPSPRVFSDGGRRLGIDISIEAARQARLVAPAVVGDATHLPFATGSFDLVHGQAILHHLPLAEALAEARRVLAPGGQLVFLEPLGHNPALRAFRALTPSLRSPDEAPLLVSDLEILSRTMDAVDLSFFDLAGLAAVPFGRLAAGRAARRRLVTVDRWLTDRIPRLASWSWWVVASARKSIE